MAVHASITVITRDGNLKYVDRLFANRNESFVWEVANRSGRTLTSITLDNFRNAAGGLVPTSTLFQKLDPISSLPNNKAGSIKLKLRSDAPFGSYSFEVRHNTNGQFETIADPEMEVCADINLLDVNWDTVPDLPAEPPFGAPLHAGAGKKPKVTKRKK